MNILYINHYAGSPGYGMEFRPYHMSKIWVEKGHSVTILAASYSHVRANQPTVNGQEIKQVTLEKIDGIDYIWYPTPKYDGNGFGRVKNIFSFLSKIYTSVSSLIKKIKPDVVIASSTYPMDIWVAKKIARKAKAKLIYEVHDLWPLSPIELGGMSPKHPFIMLCQAAENYAYKHADVVVSMLPKVHEHMQSHGLNLDKLHIIPNGVVEEDWRTEAILELTNTDLVSFIDGQRSKGKKIVTYAGAHGRPNALEYYLEAAKLLKDEDLIFLLVGSGLEKQHLQNKVSKDNIDNVFFFEPIAKKQIPSLLAKSDIAYIGLLSEPLFRFGISPNKLMDYMMAEKPIVCAIRAGNDPVADVQCGVTVEPGNPQAIADGILKIAQLPKEELEAMGKRGKEFIMKNQTYSVLAARFLKAMQS